MSRSPPVPCRAHRAARALLLPVLALLASPGAVGALEPRYDHRDQKGPALELVFGRDVFWTGSAGSTTAMRGGVRAAWGFDPSGDGDEVLVGLTFSPIQGEDTGSDRLRLVADARYRVLAGSEQLKTILDIGVWCSAADRLAAGPLVGLGFIFDFTRNVGLFAAGSLGAGLGERRILSMEGSLGFQVRYE